MIKRLLMKRSMHGYRFRLLAANGRTVAYGNPYSSWSAARDAGHRLAVQLGLTKYHLMDDGDSVEWTAPKPIGGSR